MTDFFEPALNSSAMAVPTSAGGFCAKGDADPKCAVRYAGGELFLALSPALLHANSLGAPLCGCVFFSCCSRLSHWLDPS